MILWQGDHTEIMEEIRFDKDTLGLIVRNRKGLRVPINQRSYAWKSSHVKDLFTDLNGAITAGAREYFLGSVIVVNSLGVEDLCRPQAQRAGRAGAALPRPQAEG